MIKVKFWRFGNVLVAKVLEQPEETMSRWELAEADGFSIHSCDKPEIKDNILFLRGLEKEYDNDCCCCSYNSVYDAKQALNGFKACIEKYNAEHGGVEVDEDDVETVVVG